MSIRPIQQYKCSNINLFLIYGTRFGHQFNILYFWNTAWWWLKRATYIRIKWISEHLCCNIGLITIEYFNLIKYNGMTLLRVVHNPVHCYQVSRRHMPECCNVYRHRYNNLISHKTFQGSNKAITCGKQCVCMFWVCFLSHHRLHQLNPSNFSCGVCITVLSQSMLRLIKIGLFYVFRAAIFSVLYYQVVFCCEKLQIPIFIYSSPVE